MFCCLLFSGSRRTGLRFSAVLFSAVPVRGSALVDMVADEVARTVFPDGSMVHKNMVYLSQSFL